MIWKMISSSVDKVEDFVTFYDGTKQQTRIGHDSVRCFYTRDVIAASTVTGDSVHIVVEVTGQFLWLTINGKNKWGAEC
jgi:hypothetical protein